MVEQPKCYTCGSKAAGLIWVEAAQGEQMNEEWKAIKQRIEAAGLPTTVDHGNPLYLKLCAANSDRRRLDEMLGEAVAYLVTQRSQSNDVDEYLAELLTELCVHCAQKAEDIERERREEASDGKQC